VMSAPAATMPTIESIRQTVERTRSVVIHTPLVPLRGPSAGENILIKPEIHQAVGSFKIRGVFNAAASMTDEERSRGLSTVSAGNTAQAVAWCGRYFGVPARSIMPDTAPQTKIDAVRALGGEPVLLPGDDLFAYMREHGWENEPYSFIHPWTDERVMTGHAGMGLEILDDDPDIDSVFIPVGGGGLIAGVASALKLLKPDIRIFAVEPEECCALHASLAAGHAVAAACTTMSDGVAVPYLTSEMFPLLAELVDETVLVSEEETKAVVRSLAFDHKMIVEGAGALATAAANKVSLEQRGKSVAIVTGGGIDMNKFLGIVSGT
jgi:threonine dehydratase